MQKPPAAQTPVSLRKKPVQSRSQFTLGALQEAFVRVLIERGFEKITIREVVSVAGIGVGTFYDYVPNLRALAASTIHKRCTDTAEHLRASIAPFAGESFAVLTRALLQALVREGFGKPKEWTALLLLERQVSSAAALRKIHESYVGIWASALSQSSDKPPEDKLQSVARMAHALSYGWYSHDLLFYADDPKHQRSLEEMIKAIAGLLPSSLG